MRLGVLASPRSWYLRDLRRAAGEAHEVVPLAFTQLESSVGGRQSCRVASDRSQLDQFDVVLVRSMPPGSLEQVVFRMDALGRLAESGTAVVNPPRAIEAAVDKYLALAKLAASGLPVPPTRVCQSVDAAMRAFAELGGDIVLKPLFGGEGRGIARVNDEALAQRTFQLLDQLGAVIYLQQYLPHFGHDLRLFVVGEKILAARRSNAKDWRTNVSRGAVMEAAEQDITMEKMARQAADAVGAPLAGVDLLPTKSGQTYVLEVNAVPGWRALARALKRDVGRIVLDYLLETAQGKEKRGSARNAQGRLR